MLSLSSRHNHCHTATPIFSTTVTERITKHQRSSQLPFVPPLTFRHSAPVGLVIAAWSAGRHRLVVRRPSAPHGPRGPPSSPHGPRGPPSAPVVGAHF